MNIAVIVFWLNAVAIVAIGVGVLYTVARDLLVSNEHRTMPSSIWEWQHQRLTAVADKYILQVKTV